MYEAAPKAKSTSEKQVGFHSSIQNIDCVFDAIENTRECVEPVLISKQICCLEKSPF